MELQQMWRDLVTATKARRAVEAQMQPIVVAAITHAIESEVANG